MSSSSDQPKPPSSRPPRPPRRVGALLGLGLDNDDGHKRITRGDKFMLVGGSAETHERMTETTVKTFEELKRRDKSLDTVDPRELAEILHKSSPR